MLGARPGLVAGLLVNLGLHIPPTQLSLAAVLLSASARSTLISPHFFRIFYDARLNWVAAVRLDKLPSLRITFLALRLQRRGSQI